MTVTDFYNLCLIKIEKNGTNDNISLDYSRFVILAKSSFIKYVKMIYESKSDDSLRDIQNLLITAKLQDGNISKTYTEFELPNNFFNHSSVRASAHTESCSKSNMELFEVKDLDNDLILNDAFNKPSFKYREAPYIFSSNNIRVFTNSEFVLDEVLLTYYRYPKFIKLEDEENPEFGLVEDVLDFDDKALETISSLLAREFDINTSNPRFQVQEARINK